MATIFEYLTEVDSNLLFSTKDPEDMRLGDLVHRFTAETNINLLKEADVAIIGIPDDVGVIRNNGRTGAREAPIAVRKAFSKLTPGCKNSISKLNIIDIGNIKTHENIEKTHNNVKKVVSEISRLNIPLICIGGGHDITYPSIVGFMKGYRLKKSLRKANCKFGLMNVDSHFDVRNLKHGITSGTSFYRILELPDHPIIGENFIEFGIQEQYNSPTHQQYLVKKNVNIHFLDEIQSKGITKSLKEAFDLANLSTESIYVSFDIDAIRMSDAPGASASHVNGLSAKEAEIMAYLVGKNPKVGMIDIMEICPPLDQDHKTAKLGASMMFNFLKGFTERMN